MKKSELKKIIKEEIQKVLKEEAEVMLSGFNLAQAYNQKQWGEILQELMDQDMKASQAKALVNRLKAEALVLEVDLDDSNMGDDDEALNPYIETPTPIAKLAKVNPDWAKTYAAKGYKYFSFVPVDYNRGTNYINLAVSKSKDLLTMIGGEY